MATQTDFGNPQYLNGLGYEFKAIILSWTNLSISSVVFPSLNKKNYIKI
jgi:hypothetical protein